MRIELLFGVGGVGWGVCGGGGGRGEQKVNRWSTIYRWTRCMCMRCCDNLSICHCHSIPHAIYMIFGIRFTTWECIMHSHVVHLYECNFWMIHLMIPAPKWLHEIWMWYDGWSSNDFASPSVLWVLQRREDWLQLVAGQVAEHTSHNAGSDNAGSDEEEDRGSEEEDWLWCVFVNNLYIFIVSCLISVLWVLQVVYLEAGKE